MDFKLLLLLLRRRRRRRWTGNLLAMLHLLLGGWQLTCLLQ